MIPEPEALRLLGEVGAVITDSHIVYTSGKHGSAYINKDVVYRDPKLVSRLCSGMASVVKDLSIDTVIAPAVGGVALEQWVTLHLQQHSGRKIEAIYAEKETVSIRDPENAGRVCYAETGRFVIKRGYVEAVRDGRGVLVVEDILNTGGSALKVMEAVRSHGGNVVGVVAPCNRGGVTADMLGDVPLLQVLVNVQMDAWEPAECPLCQQSVPINTDVGHGKDFLANASSS